ncbi:MAG: hypothetical protein ACLGJB_10780 [Blastocatellia bacterium]
MQVEQANLDHFIELLFQGAEAYRLALKVYADGYEVIIYKDAYTFCAISLMIIGQERMRRRLEN